MSLPPRVPNVIDLVVEEEEEVEEDVRDQGFEDDNMEPAEPVVEAGTDRTLLRIESIEHYIQKNGLEDARYGAQSEYHLAETRNRLQEEADYQQDVHRSIFGADDAADGQSPESGDRQDFLASIRDENVDIETSQTVIRDVPLKPLVESCETLFTMATFRQSYQQNDKRLSFSLKSFPHEAVVEFIAIMLGDKRAEQVLADHVVGCCEIARYLQCPSVLEAMVDILMVSVDNANCMSLCQLADQLDIPRLFERSMLQMMQSVETLQEHEVWDDFYPELKSRIVDMQTAMRSSIHADVHKIFFGSIDEYISIFEENVDYYRERLAEANERQAQEQPGGRAWNDVQRKIRNQKRRLQTLELVLKDQKELFGKMGQGRARSSRS